MRVVQAFIFLLLGLSMQGQSLPVEDLPWRPAFGNEIEDDSFSDFLTQLRSDLRSCDSSRILPHFEEYPRWGKYNCCGGMDDDGRCKQVDVMSCYGKDISEFADFMMTQMAHGIGVMADRSWFMDDNETEVVYSTHHFKDDALEKKFFNYELTVVLSPFARVYAEPAEDSQLLGFGPSYFERSLDVGEQIWENGCWQEVDFKDQVGYMQCKDLLTGFDYVRFMFRQTDGVWKVCSIIQPPGC